MRIAILFALLGVALASPAAEREAPASSNLSHDTPSSEELWEELDTSLGNHPDDRDSQESESEESDETEDFFQNILDFLYAIAQSDDSKEGSNEDDSNFYGFIFGMFWEPGAKEPAVISEYLTPEVRKAQR